MHVNLYYWISLQPKKVIWPIFKDKQLVCWMERNTPLLATYTESYVLWSFFFILRNFFLHQCVTNTIFRPEYKYEYIWVNIFWRIQIRIYSGSCVLATMNTNIFGSHFLDKYKYKYIWVHQKRANINTNTIIWTDICEYKYKYEYYHTKYIYISIGKLI